MSKHPNSQSAIIIRTQSSNLISSSTEPPRETYYQWQTEIFPTYQGIYFIYDKYDQLLYIGKAKKVKDRLDHHCTSFNSHIKKFSKYFYKVETVQVHTGDLDTALWEVYYINKYAPIFNKKDVLYLGQKKISKRISTYRAECGSDAAARTTLEENLMAIGFPPEDGHLYNLWEEVQSIADNDHQYHSNQGMKATDNVIKQWIEKEKLTFLGYIREQYVLTTIEEVEEKLRRYVRFDERNIFSTSSDPDKGWNPLALSEYY